MIGGTLIKSNQGIFDKYRSAEEFEDFIKDNIHKLADDLASDPDDIDGATEAAYIRRALRKAGQQ